MFGPRSVVVRNIVNETTSFCSPKLGAHTHVAARSNEYFVLVGRRAAQKMSMLAACTVALLVVLSLLVPSARAAGFLVNPNPMQPSTFYLRRSSHFIVLLATCPAFFQLPLFSHCYPLIRVMPVRIITAMGCAYGPSTIIVDPLFCDDGYVFLGGPRRDGTVDGTLANRQFKV